MGFKLIYRIHEKIKGRNVLSKLDELEVNQYKTVEELDTIQSEKILDIINIAVYNIPYYKEIKKQLEIVIDDNNPREIIRQFPILNKESIIENFESLVNPNIDEKVNAKFSGGSSGEPVKILQNKNRNDYNTAAMKRSDKWAGFDLGTSVFQFWGATKDMESNFIKKIKNTLSKRYIFDASNWNENTIVDIYNKMERVKPDIILAYSSALYFYVKTVKDKGLVSKYKPKGIITTSDMLYDYQREEIEEYFKIKVFNRYGSRETGFIASECEEHNGLHMSTDRLYIEIVDEDNNLLPNGEIGRILITDLTNTAMPLIRYEIGDMGSLNVNEKCGCGRNLTKLNSIEGRISEYIITESGDHIRVPAYIVVKFLHVKQMQLVQNDYEHITIKIVRNYNYNLNYEAKIIDILKEYIDSLLNEKSGKYRFIINNTCD